MDLKIIFVLLVVVSVSVSENVWDRPTVDVDSNVVPMFISHPLARAFTQNELSNTTIDAELTIRVVAHRQLDHFATSDAVDAMIDEVYGDSIQNPITLRELNSILVDLYSLTRTIARENGVELYPVCHLRGHSKNLPIVLMLPLKAHNAHAGHMEGDLTSSGDLIMVLRNSPRRIEFVDEIEKDLCFRREPCDLICPDLDGEIAVIRSVAERERCCEVFANIPRRVANYDEVTLCGIDIIGVEEKLRGTKIPDDMTRCECDLDVNYLVSAETYRKMDDEDEEVFEEKLIINNDEEIGAKPIKGSGRPVKRPGRPTIDISEDCGSIPVNILVEKA